MKTKKSKRARWFNLVVGGIAFMVLACSIAEARKHVTEYQANPNGYVVAVNQATKQTMIMQQIKATAQKERQILSQKHNLLNVKNSNKSHTFKAKITRVGGSLVLTTSLYINGKLVDKANSTIPEAMQECTINGGRACVPHMCIGQQPTKPPSGPTYWTAKITNGYAICTR